MIYVLWAMFEVVMFGGAAATYFGLDMNQFPLLLIPIVMTVLGVIGLMPILGDAVGDILEAIVS